eukprot:gene7555-9834_t
MGLMDSASPIRLVGAVVSFVAVFIGSAIIWNVVNDEDSVNLPDDMEAAINYYLFTLWIFGFACIGAALIYSSEAKHNALVIFAFSLFSLHFIGISTDLSSIGMFPMPTSFVGMTLIRDNLDQDRDELDKLFAGGFFAITGMLVGLLSVTARMDILSSVSTNLRVIKLVSLLTVLFTGGISVLTYWSAEDIRDPNQVGVYAYTAAIMVVMFATTITVAGTHKGVAAFLLAFGGIFSIIAMSLGLLISAGFSGNNRNRDTARAGMVFATASSIVSLVPAFLVLQETSAE